MNEKRREKHISAGAKLLFAFIPVIILVLLELTARLFVPSGEIPDIHKYPDPPKVVMLEEEGSTDEERLRENYRILTTRPIASLPFLKQDKVVLYHPKPEPGLSFTFMTPLGEVINYSFNSQGFRGDDFDPEKPEGKTRIVCAGDSSTFGYLVNIEDTYPVLLEGLISKETGSDSFEVINAGMVGYSSYQGLKYFETRLRRLEPNILVVSYGYNDTSLEAKPDALIKMEGEWTTKARSTLKHLALYRLIEKFLSGPQDEKKLSGKAPRVSLNEYRANLEKLASCCREDGISLVFVPISVPARYFEVMRDVADKNNAGFVDTERVFRKTFERIENEGLADYKGVLFGAPSRRSFELEFLKRLGSEEMMRIRGTNHLFMDYCHPTTAGNLMVAEEVFGYFTSHGLLEQGGY